MHNCLNSYLLFLVFLHGHHAFQISPGAQLDKIHEITTNEAAAACVENQYELVPIPIPTSNYKSEEEKAELAANLIQDTKGIGNYELIHSSLKHLLKDTTLVDEVHFWKLWIEGHYIFLKLFHFWNKNTISHQLKESETNVVALIWLWLINFLSSKLAWVSFIFLSKGS